jgi:hypothetical protein
MVGQDEVMTWDELTTEAPDLAAAVRRSFAQGKHKVMATLRQDGSPRVSGTEVTFFDGEAWLGSMPGSVKARDLRHDPRVALHSPTIDETMAQGDAKLTGRAHHVTDPAELARFVKGFSADAGHEPPQPFDLFRLDITEAVCTRVDGDHLVIDSWHEGRGVRRVERQ